ncbi:sporulation protein YtxC [Alteribacillus sp. HJP-4]|uniref:sporulation protein YtxC n=1 Tax=Alteribacillus sp. HJP-4 TaxID=2775394 RepID=UPI0035CD0166
MFSIGLDSETESQHMYYWLMKEKTNWERQGFSVGNLKKSGDRIEWEFNGTEDQWKESVVPFLASILCDYMIKNKEQQWVKQYVEQMYYEGDEARAISEVAYSLLEGVRKEIPETALLQTRKHFIYRELVDEMNEKCTIQWGPLLTFRFGAYHRLLLKAAAAAVDEYKWEQEYQTMIESCRYYLKKAPPSYGAIHVLAAEKPVFLDESLQLIDQWTRLRHLEPTIVFEKSLPFENMVVSPAVSMAPQKIHLYAKDDNSTVQTFEMIFQEKLIKHPVEAWPR